MTRDYISVSEAVKMAASIPGTPRTYNGLVSVGKDSGFIKTKLSKDRINRKIICDKEKFNEYLKFIKTHYTLVTIAEELNRTYGGILVTVYKKLGITGEKKYGKNYYTKKERNKIISHFNKKINNG